jgi:adenylate cyclase
MALSVFAVRTQQNCLLAQELLSRAVALDPKCSRAFSISAFIAAMEVLWGWRPRASLQCAFDSAQMALLIDEDEPWAHLALGWVLTQNRAPDAGVEEYYKARALCPHVPCHAWLSIALGYLGRFEKALLELDTAEHQGIRELFRGVNNSARASISFCMGRHQDAALAARRSVLENPFLITSQRQLIVNHALTGQIGEAREGLGTFNRLVPNASLQTIAGSLPNIRDAEQSKVLEAFHSLGVE